MRKILHQILSHQKNVFFHFSIIVILMILLPIMPVYVNVLLWIGYMISQIIRYTANRVVFTLAYVFGLIASSLNLVLTHFFGYSLFIAIPTAVVMLTVIGIVIVEIARFIRKKDLRGILYALSSVLFLAFFEVVFGNIHVRSSGAYLLIYERFEFLNVYWLFLLGIENNILFYYVIMSGICVTILVITLLSKNHHHDIAVSTNSNKS